MNILFCNDEFTLMNDDRLCVPFDYKLFPLCHSFHFYKMLVFIIVTSSIAFLPFNCLLHFSIHHYCKLLSYSFEEKVVLNTCNHMKIYVVTLPWNMGICEVIQYVWSWVFSYVGLLLMCFQLLLKVCFVI
jgi:hypothetical protein